MPKHYYLFGLTVASKLPLPALPGDLDTDSEPDVVINYGDTPSTLASPQITGIRFQASPGEFLLQVDGVARFLVKNGSSITISPEPVTHEEDILPFLMGSAFGALLQQRKILVLHGSAIEVNGASVLFCGPSGAGKSTLAAGFHQRGYRFLADDLCAISIINSQPMVTPGFPRLKLWADALKRLETSTDNLHSIRWGADLQKFFLPAENRATLPLPVQAVFILGSTNTDQLKLTPLPGNERIDPLIDNSYRGRFLEGLGGKKEHFKLCAALAAKADVCLVSRPKLGFRLEELMDLVKKRLAA